QADGASDVGRSSLELLGCRSIRGLLKRDGLDHVASGLPGRHRLEMAELAVEHSDAHGPENLVAGERVEIAIEVLNVDINVGNRLGSVDDDRGAVLVSHLDHELD